MKRDDVVVITMKLAIEREDAEEVYYKLLNDINCRGFVVIDEDHHSPTDAEWEQFLDACD